MKKLFILIAAAAMSTAANAQWFIGGGFKFNKSTDKFLEFDGDKLGDPEKTGSIGNYQFAPYFGYSFENWEVGAGFGIGSLKTETDNGNGGFDESNVKNRSAYVYARRYFPLAGNFSWFVDGGVGYSRGMYDMTPDCKLKDSSFSIGFTPGIYWQISEHWGVDLAIEYFDLSYEVSRLTTVDSDGEVIGDAESASEFNFAGNTDFGSLKDIFDEALSISVCYCF